MSYFLRTKFAVLWSAGVIFLFLCAGDAAAGRPGGALERGGEQGCRSVQLHKSAGRQLYARGVEAVRADG